MAESEEKKYKSISERNAETAKKVAEIKNSDNATIADLTTGTVGKSYISDQYSKQEVEQRIVSASSRAKMFDSGESSQVFKQNGGVSIVNTEGIDHTNILTGGFLTQKTDRAEFTNGFDSNGKEIIEEKNAHLGTDSAGYTVARNGKVIGATANYDATTGTPPSLSLSMSKNLQKDEVYGMNGINTKNAFKNPAYKEVSGLFGNRNLDNLENGGSVAYAKTLDLSSSVSGVSLKGSSFKPSVGVTLGRTEGDTFNNSSINVTAGVGASLLGAVYTSNKGKTSDSGWGYMVGGQLTPYGPEAVGGFSYTKNGVQRTFNIAGLVQNAATGNFVGVGMNLVQMIKGQKIAVPPYEVAAIDESPNKHTTIPLFDKKAVALNEQGKSQLDEIANEFARNRSNGILQLGMYYDERWNGTRGDSNHKLSEDRALVIKEYLISKGVPVDQIKLATDNFINKDVNAMTVNSNNTNIAWTTTQDISVNIDGHVAHFNAKRLSPMGNKIVEEIMNMPEFKEAAKGQNSREIDMLANMVFNNVQLDKNFADYKTAIKEIKEQVYDKGNSLTKLTSPLSEKDVIENVKNDELFKKYSDATKIDKKEQQALANLVVSYNKNNPEGVSLQQVLIEHKDKFLARGYSLSKMDETIKEIGKEMGKNPEYNNIIQNKTKAEVNLINQEIVSLYISHKINGQYMPKEMLQTAITASIKGNIEKVYEQGKSLESIANQNRPTSQYAKEKEKEVDIYMKINEFKDKINQIPENSREKFIDEFKQNYKEYPRLTANDLFKMTESKLTVNDAPKVDSHVNKDSIIANNNDNKPKPSELKNDIINMSAINETKITRDEESKKMDELAKNQNLNNGGLAYN